MSDVPGIPDVRIGDYVALGFDHLVYEVRPPFNWREFYVQRPQEKPQDNYRLVVVSASLLAVVRLSAGLAIELPVIVRFVAVQFAVLLRSFG